MARTPQIAENETNFPLHHPGKDFTFDEKDLFPREIEVRYNHDDDDNFDEHEIQTNKVEDDDKFEESHTDDSFQYTAAKNGTIKNESKNDTKTIRSLLGKEIERTFVEEV